MPALLTARILMDLAGDVNNLVDVTARAVSARGSYGRQATLFDYRAGTASIVLAVDDSLLVPGLDGSTYRTDRLYRRLVKVEMRADSGSWKTVFAGTVDKVAWRPTETEAYATITAVDRFQELASQTVTLPATTPAERTDERLQRILTAASYSGTSFLAVGTVDCVALTAAQTGNALSLCRQVADTEGGRLFVSQSTADPGKLTFLSRASGGNSKLVVSDLPGFGQASYADRPQAIADPRLLVTVTRFTDGDGQTVIRENTAYVDLYGRQELVRTLLSSATDAADLSDWWLAIFGQPVSRISRTRLDAHLEDAAVAEIILDLTVGDVVTFRIQQPGAPTATMVLYGIDGISWRIFPLGAYDDRVGFVATLTLFPPPIRQYWLVGDSDRGELGLTTSLAPMQVPPDLDHLWEDDDVVSTYRFDKTIAARRITVYDSVAERDAAEINPTVGQSCRMLDDMTERIWTGRGWRYGSYFG